jgi:hypothetical protein
VLAFVLAAMLVTCIVGALILLVLVKLGALERLNLWFGRHGRLVAIVVCAGAGVYMLARSLKDLLG